MKTIPAGLVFESLPDLPSPEDWDRQLQENIDRYPPR